MSIELVMFSNHLILCCPRLLLPSFPELGSFLVSWLPRSGGQIIGASASASVFRMNIQSWFPLGLTGLISWLSKGLLRVFSNTAIWKHPFFGAQPSLWSSSYLHTWLLEIPSLWLYGRLLAKWSLLFNMLCRFVIVFLPRSKHFLISWMQSVSTVILEPKKRKSVTASTFSPSICMKWCPMIFFLMLNLFQLFHCLPSQYKKAERVLFLNTNFL